jgi:hypothetical protein
VVLGLASTIARARQGSASSWTSREATACGQSRLALVDPGALPSSCCSGRQDGIHGNCTTVSCCRNVHRGGSPLGWRWHLLSNAERPSAAFLAPLTASRAAPAGGAKGRQRRTSVRPRRPLAGVHQVHHVPSARTLALCTV